MSAKITKTATKKDIYEAFDELMDQLFKKVETSFSTNLDDMKEDLLTEIRHIRIHMAEMKADMRAIHKMLQYWSKENMSPDFMEEVVSKKIITTQKQKLN